MWLFIYLLFSSRASVHKVVATAIQAEETFLNIFFTSQQNMRQKQPRFHEFDRGFDRSVRTHCPIDVMSAGRPSSIPALSKKAGLKFIQPKHNVSFRTNKIDNN